MIFALFCAGALGATTRFLLSKKLNDTFPYGTIISNLLAALLLGILSSAADTAGTFYLLAGIGFAGAFSTWSTLANEVASMARKGKSSMAILYLWFMMSSGILLAWVGISIGNTF